MFEAHGSHKISAKENILFIEGCGSWNKEEAKSFQYDVSQVVQTQIEPFYQYFGAIITMKDWYPTIDAIETLTGVTLVGISKGMRFEAVIETDYLSMKILMNKVFPENSENYTKRVIPTATEAEQWVVENLAPLDCNR